MYGNVWEWCDDTWHSNYKNAYIDGTAWRDNVEDSDASVLRGGSWFDDPNLCRSAFRNDYMCAYTIDNIGFRICCVLGRTLTL